MDIEQRVKQVIVDKLGINEEEITNEQNFIQDLRADSLDVVDLVMGLEEEFEIEISEEDRENIQTVGEAIDYIKSILKNQKGKITVTSVIF